MSYRITPYTLAQAEKLGVIVKPSKVRGKKLDVFKNRCKKGTAEKRRRAYKIRHQKDRTIRGSNGWFADKLLW